MKASAAITGIERCIFQMGILDRNKVKLSYDVDVLPILRCPASGRVIDLLLLSARGVAMFNSAACPAQAKPARSK